VPPESPPAGRENLDSSPSPDQRLGPRGLADSVAWYLGQNFDVDEEIGGRIMTTKDNRLLHWTTAAPVSYVTYVRLAPGISVSDCGRLGPFVS
jgi:hypothetical protein